MHDKKEERQEGWPGAHVMLIRKDGGVLQGTFLGYLGSCSGRCLRLFCDWGKCDIPERLVAEAHFS